jgi:glycosyltransferase involved in cell wall biosynthesis
LVDPLDIHALASAIDRVLNDAELRSTLRARGLEQIQKFSWGKAARETLAVLESAAARP